MPLSTRHKFTLIWLHGLNQTAHTWVDMFTKGKLQIPETCRVVIPTAPFRQIKAGMRINSWYDFTGVPFFRADMPDQTALEHIQN